MLFLLMKAQVYKIFERKSLLQTLIRTLFYPFFLIQNSIPILNGGSRIINVSSGAGEISNGMGTYSPVYRYQ